MAYTLTCDSCEFDLGVDEEVRAYSNAKEHEAEHPAHFVFIESAE